MPTIKQYQRMREAEFEFPGTRRQDDPMYHAPKPSQKNATMLTIHKYALLSTIGEQSIEVPQGAHVLKVANQFENVCIWFEVQEGHPKETRKFKVVQTGDEVNPCTIGKYLDTVLLKSGHEVVHVYEQYS